MNLLPLRAMLADRPLLHSVTCPNCYKPFLAEETLWVSVHPDLADDPILPSLATGERQPRRFIAERFDVHGRAIDAEGASCEQLACPRCRLSIPRATVEVPALNVSILGAPGSGKSVFLTSMTFSLRQLAARLGLKFQDADLPQNRMLIDDERKMFHDEQASSFRPINRAVEKTQENGRRYLTACVDGREVNYLAPFTFVLGPAAWRDVPGGLRSLLRLLCIYDNAGEHFHPGVDAPERPMTRHLAQSHGLVFVFDPTRDRRVRDRLDGSRLPRTAVDRQDVVLIEAANRIRAAASGPGEPGSRPLVVAVTKYDAWQDLAPNLRGFRWLRPNPGSDQLWFDRNALKSASDCCREFLLTYCPELVTVAEEVAQNVTFVPVAAVGWDVRTDPTTGQPSFQAAQCEPFNVVVPLLSLLARTVPRLVPTEKCQP